MLLYVSFKIILNYFSKHRINSSVETLFSKNPCKTFNIMELQNLFFETCPESTI